MHRRAGSRRAAWRGATVTSEPKAQAEALPEAEVSPGPPAAREPASIPQAEA